MKISTMKDIFYCAQSVTINMNDSFYYASADSADIDIEDLKDLEPMIQVYGFEAFIAYEAIKRGHDPSVPILEPDDFKLAKSAILQAMDNPKKFYDLRLEMPRG